jgi:hypothetical protein
MLNSCAYTCVRSWRRPSPFDDIIDDDDGDDDGDDDYSQKTLHLRLCSQTSSTSPYLTSPSLATDCVPISPSTDNHDEGGHDDEGDDDDDDDDDDDGDDASDADVNHNSPTPASTLPAPCSTPARE